jgi:hypothetical protein
MSISKDTSTTLTKRSFKARKETKEQTRKDKRSYRTNEILIIEIGKVASTNAIGRRTSESSMREKLTYGLMRGNWK